MPADGGAANDRVPLWRSGTINVPSWSRIAPGFVSNTGGLLSFKLALFPL
jgi:hypothetical protein